MKDREISKAKPSTGAGYLIGAVIGIITGITLFIITGEIAVSISPAVALGIPVGISIDQKLTGKSDGFNTMRVRLVLTTIIVGILFFISVALLVRFL